MHLLTLNGITAGYGPLTVLHNVSLHIDTGEIVCVLGANGAGKTTLLRAISRLIPLSSGSIEFFGKDVACEKAHRVAALGVSHVPEGRGVFGNLTVSENLVLATYASRTPAALRIAHVYELFPVLGTRKRQRASTLSGGEQQMLAIGRAIVADGDLFVLDEPSMGLSPLFVKNLFAIISQINKQGKTVLVVEQNATMALAHSTRAYVLENGSVVAEGTSGQIAADERIKKAYLG
jgi:branched-chain amino acid transport system ATP-binding protein